MFNNVSAFLLRAVFGRGAEARLIDVFMKVSQLSWQRRNSEIYLSKNKTETLYSTIQLLQPQEQTGFTV